LPLGCENRIFLQKHPKGHFTIHFRFLGIKKCAYPNINSTTKQALTFIFLAQNFLQLKQKKKTNMKNYTPFFALNRKLVATISILALASLVFFSCVRQSAACSSKSKQRDIKRINSIQYR
jgi:hypothetical protein